MPKEGISLYFSIQDGASNVLSSIADKTKALDKETQELAGAQDALRKANEPLIEKQAALTAQLTKLKDEAKGAKRDWEEYGDALHQDIYEGLLADQGRVTQELREVNDQVNANRKTFREYQEELRKGGSSGGALGGGEGGEALGLAGIARALVAGQAGQMLTSSLGGAAQSYLTSALGTPTANVMSEAFGSALQGAALGTAIAPGIGTAIGAGLGALSGAISGGTKIFEEQDSVFKEYYNGFFDNALAAREERVGSGSGIAAQRETDTLSFTTLFGDRGIADAYLEDLVEMANRTPFLYDDLTALSKTLATYGYAANEILPVMKTIGDAGAALGMGTSDMTAVATAIGRMTSSGKASLEYLNILNDRGIGAVGMLAEAKGVSQGEMYEMISKSQISGGEAASIILDALSRDKTEGGYAGSMLEQSQTYAGLSSTLEGLLQEQQNSAGEQYNTLRAAGLREEIEAYGGALGGALREVNGLSGMTQAYRENLQEQYRREALGAVLLGERTTLYDEETAGRLRDMNTEFADAQRAYDEAVAAYGEGSRETQKAAYDMQNLRDKAETLAQAAFDSSEDIKTLQGTQTELIEATRSLAAAFDGWKFEYQLGVERTKGLAAAGLSGLEPGAQVSGGSESAVARRTIGLGGTPSSSGYSSPEGAFGGHHRAFGLDRVPYDEYPALLHEGERVLTKQEAQAEDQAATAALRALMELSRGGTGSDTPRGAEAAESAQEGRNVTITVTGNHFSGVGSEAAEQVAEVIAARLEQAQTVYGR